MNKRGKKEPSPDGDGSQRVKKVVFDTLTDGQESPKGKKTLSVGVHGYGKTKFSQQVKILAKQAVLM